MAQKVFNWFKDSEAATNMLVVIEAAVALYLVFTYNFSTNF
jgi:hypothetical protein